MNAAGAVCPKCRASRLRIYSARSVGNTRVRYLRCDACHHRDKQIVALDAATGRPKFFCDAIARTSKATSPNATGCE